MSPGSKVLDIGAGNGLLACVLEELNKEVIIDGIEINPYAAEKARVHYRNFYCGPAQDYFDIIKQGNYDFVVLADVIEHIPDPLEFLTELTHKLPVSTRLVISVPNVAFGAIRLALLNGNFDYVDSGLLEKSHLRFFTLKTLQALVSELGLYVETLSYLKRNVFETEVAIELMYLDPFLVYRLLKDELASTYQFLLVVCKEPRPFEAIRHGKTANSTLVGALKQYLGALPCIRQSRALLRSYWG